MSSSYYIAQRKKYYALKNNLRTISSNLASSRTNINNASEYVKNNFTFDDATADNGTLDKNKANIDEIVNTINNSIIGAIDSKISSLTITIERELKREKEENAQNTSR